MSTDRGSIFDILLRLVRFGLAGTIASGANLSLGSTRPTLRAA